MEGLTKAEKLEYLGALQLKAMKRARNSLLDFTTFTFPGYQVNWHHKLLCQKLDEFVDGPIDRLMVFMPPRNGKSELVSRRLPAYILGRNPDAEVIACSYSADLASRMNRDVQRIIDSNEFAALFPETQLSSKGTSTGLKGKWLRNSDIFEIPGRRGIYRSAGVGGGITGMGFNVGIIDDPIKNRDEADSATYRDKVWDWFTSTFLTRMEKNGKMLLTLTRWHSDDLAGRLLEISKGKDADKWEVISLPAIADTDSVLNEFDPRNIGDPLWPEKYNLEMLGKIKGTIGSRDWSALFQQRPSIEGGELVQRSWFKYYKEPPANFHEIIQSWDFTFKDVSTSDFAVGQVWGRRDGEKWLLDQFRGRMGFVESIQAIKNLSAKWPKATLKLIEDKANGPAVIDSLKRQLPGIVPVTPQGSKMSRVYSVSPQIEAGNVHLPDPTIAPWVSDYVEEWVAFPNGKHDDQVDASTQALQRLGSSQSESLKKLLNW